MLSTETTIRNLLSRSIILLKVFLAVATLLCTDFILCPFPIAFCNLAQSLITIVVPSGTDASCHQNNFAHKLSFQYCFVYVRDTCFLLDGIILWWCPAKSGLSILLSFQLANINKETKTTVPISGAMLSIPANPPQFINISPDIFHLTLFSFYSSIPFCYPFFDWRFFATFTPSVSKPYLAVFGSWQYLLTLCFLGSF